MQNDSDPPASEEDQTNVGCITAKVQLTIHKRKTYEVNSTSEDWFVTLEVNGAKTRFKIDSGSQVNIIPKKDYQLLKNKPGLKPTRRGLTAYNGTSIPVLGKCAVQIPHKNKTYEVPIIVTDTDAYPILGLKTSADMHLIKKVPSFSKGEPVFLSKFKLTWGTRDITRLSPHYNGPKYKTHHKPTTQSTICHQTETKTGAATNDSA